MIALADETTPIERPDGDPDNIAWALEQARYITRTGGVPGHLAEDCESVALVALVESARRFDPGRGTDFRSYAFARIRGAIRDLCRAEMPAGYTHTKQRAKHGEPPKTVSIVEAVAVDSRTVELGDLIPSGEHPVGWEIESADEVRRIARLTGDPRESECLRLLYLHAEYRGHQKRVGPAMGVSESRVSQILWSAGNHLRLRARQQPSSMGV